MKAMNMKGNILKIYSNNGSMDRARQAGGADVLSIPVKRAVVSARLSISFTTFGRIILKIVSREQRLFSLQMMT